MEESVSAKLVVCRKCQIVRDLDKSGKALPLVDLVHRAPFQHPIGAISPGEQFCHPSEKSHSGGL